LSDEKQDLEVKRRESLKQFRDKRVELAQTQRKLDQDLNRLIMDEIASEELEAFLATVEEEYRLMIQKLDELKRSLDLYSFYLRQWFRKRK